MKRVHALAYFKQNSGVLIVGESNGGGGWSVVTERVENEKGQNHWQNLHVIEAIGSTLILLVK